MSCPQDSINVYKHVKVCLITHYVSHLPNYLCSFYIPVQKPIFVSTEARRLTGNTRLVFIVTISLFLLFAIHYYSFHGHCLIHRCYPE